MSTISQLKTNHDTVIRQKTAPKSISTDNHADLLDSLADEVLDRGVTQVLDTTELQALSGANYKNVVVKDNGIYKWKSSGTANGTTIFAATGGGVYEKQFGAIQNLIVDITYANLVTLINSSSLIIGLKYRITDFQTVHYMMNDGTILTDVNPSGDINVGTIEPLIVTAITSDTLDKLAISETYPQDIIYYDWNPENWKKDISFSNYTITFDLNTTSIVPGWKGVIYFRHDTIWDNYKHNDFRNVKYRRYKPTAGDWSNLTPYVTGDWVYHAGSYHKCLQDNTGQTPPSLFGTSVYWFRACGDHYSDVNNRYFLIKNIQGLVKDTSSYRDWKSFDHLTGTLQSYNSYDSGGFVGNHFDIEVEDQNFWNFSGTTLDNVLLIFGGSIFRVGSNIISGQSCNSFIVGSYNSVYRTIINSHILYGGSTQNTIRYCENFIGGKILSSDVIFSYNSLIVNIAQCFGQVGGIVHGLIGYNGSFYHKTKYGFYIERLNGEYVDLSNNLLSATYIYNSTYSKTILKNAANVYKLLYLDGADVQQLVDPTT